MRHWQKILLCFLTVAGATMAEAKSLGEQIPRSEEVGTTPELRPGLFDGYVEPSAGRFEKVPASALLFPPKVAVHRFFKGVDGHLLTLDKSVGDQAGYRYEGVSFYVFSRELPGTVAIYDCRVRAIARQFFSRDQGCEGQDFAGVLGYVFATPTPGARAVQRCYHQAAGVHLLTPNPDECDRAGYAREAVQGYAL